MTHIFVIAGHGAGDSGAVGNGYTEAERVRALANKIRQYGGAQVTLGDLSRDYYADGGINALNIPGDWQIIELHMDSGISSARGGHVIIYAGFSPDGYDTALAEFLSSVLPGRSDLIVGRSDLANPKRAAARGYSYRLVEFGFISNSADVRIFNSRLEDLARGVLHAFGISAKPVAGTLKRPVQVPGAAVNNAGLYYRAHVADAGTLDPVHDGQTSGTTGYGKALQGLWVDTRKLAGMRINVKAHVADIGWKLYADIKHDTLIGTTGQNRRMEAIEMEAIGLPAGKELFYRTHLSGTGWTPWVKSGFSSGSVGLKKGIEAIQIKIV